MFRVVIAAIVGMALVSPSLAWLDPAAPDVDEVLNTADTRLAFYNGPSGQAEWLNTYGT